MSDHTNSPRPESPGLTPPAATPLRSALRPTAPLAAAAAGPTRHVTFAAPPHVAAAPAGHTPFQPIGPRVGHRVDCALTATANLLRASGMNPTATQETVEGIARRPGHTVSENETVPLMRAAGLRVRDTHPLVPDEDTARRVAHSTQQGMPAVALLSPPVDVHGTPIPRWMGHAMLLTDVRRVEGPTGESTHVHVGSRSYPMSETGEFTMPRTIHGAPATQSSRSIVTLAPPAEAGPAGHATAAADPASGAVGRLRTTIAGAPATGGTVARLRSTLATAPADTRSASVTAHTIAPPAATASTTARPTAPPATPTGTTAGTTVASPASAAGATTRPSLIDRFHASVAAKNPK